MDYRDDPNDYNSGTRHISNGGHSGDIPDYTAAKSAAHAEESRRLIVQHDAMWKSIGESRVTPPASSGGDGYAGDSGAGGALVVVVYLVLGFLGVLFFWGPENGRHDDSGSPPSQASLQPAGGYFTNRGNPTEPFTLPQQARPPSSPAASPMPLPTPRPETSSVRQAKPKLPESAPSQALNSYYGRLRALVGASVRYPKASLAAEEEGTCRIRISFTRDGSIKGTELIEGAGSDLLDAECKHAVKRIGQFPAVPDEAEPGRTEFLVELPIAFKLPD